MSTSRHAQIQPTSSQLPHLSPHPAYQPLSDPPSSADTLPQTNISDTIPPNTNPVGQTNLVRTSASNSDRGRYAEAQFKRSFDRFYKKYRSNQAFTLMVFSILAIRYSSKSWYSKLEQSLFIVCEVVYMVSLVRACCFEKSTVIDSFRNTYKILEYLIAHAMLFSSYGTSLSDLISFLMISYLLNAVVAYFSNRSELVKFTNQVNKKILGIRICIVVQGMLIIASPRIYIPFLLNFMPFYTIILIIILFTANLVRNIDFAYGESSQFWRTVNEKKTGVKWIFGNLFGLIAILILQASLLLIDENYEGVLKKSGFVFVAVVVWCLISLLYGLRCYNEVFNVCETLAILVENNGSIATQEEIKYVTRISNTYFRQATKQEIDNLIDGTGSGEIEMENDLEAGVENNVEEEQPKCIVCCKESASAVFMKCGHGGICFECGKEINKQQKECHMCRQKIKEILEMSIMKTNKDNVYEIIQAISNKKLELCWDDINF